MSNLALGVKPISMEVDLTPNGNFVTALRRKTGDWDDDTTIAIVFDEDTSWAATIVDDLATWNVATSDVADLIELNPSEAQLIITGAGTPVVRGAGQVNIGRSAPASGVVLGGGVEVLVDGVDQIIAVPVPGLPGHDGADGTDGADGAPGAKGDKGDTGAPGTTDYNALSNKPALVPVATSGSASDLTSGTLDPARLPALAITSVTVVASQAAMLALSVQQGDVAIRSDFTPNKAFMLSSNSPGTLADWKDITATDLVQSVAGLNGNVTAAGLATAIDAALATNLADNGTAAGAAVAANQLTGLTAAGTRRDAVDARVAIPTRSQVQHRLAGTTEPGAFIAWTADDGYTTQPSFFALLAARGLKGTLFLSTGFVDKAGTNVTWGDTYITTAQVNALVAAGHELGTHGVNHEAYEDYRVANGDAALSALVASAVATIKTSFGVDVKTGAYPGGQSSPRVREIVGRTHEFYRGTKGVVAHRGQPPFDVSGIDIRDLTEAQIKAYVDEANAAGSLVVFLLHGGLTAPMLTAFGNVMDYATGLGIRQGTFNQGMTERTAIRGSAGMMVDTKGNAYAQSLRTPRVELTRDDSTAGITPYWSIDPITNVPFYDAGSSVPFEFRKPIKLVGTTSDLNIGTRTIFGDGVTTNLSATLDSGAAGFDQSDVGRTITGAGIPGGTTILAVVSPTRVTMSAQASVTATSVVITLGRPTNPVLNAAGQSIFFNNPQVRSSGSPAVVFQDLISTALGTISPATWSRAAAGGAMLIDSGTGGSYVTIKAFGVKYTDHTGALTITNKLGTGTPEGALAANPGSVFHRTDGGAGTSFYVKESGTGNTGWVAK